MGTSLRLAPISSRNDFIVLPIKLSPAKTVPDFDFGRHSHSINFQRNYTYTKEQQLKQQQQQTNKCRAGVCSNNKHKAWDQKEKKFAYLPWKIGAEPATRRSFDFDMRTFVNLNLELALLVPCACVSLALRIFCAAAPK